jgi:hypothetical protein
MVGGDESFLIVMLCPYVLPVAGYETVHANDVLDVSTVTVADPHPLAEAPAAS